MTWRAISTSALFNHVPSQVRTLIVPEVLGSVRDNFRRFSAILFNFGAIFAWVRSQNTPSFQVPGLVRNIIQRVHSYQALPQSSGGQAPAPATTWAMGLDSAAASAAAASARSSSVSSNTAT